MQTRPIGTPSRRLCIVFAPMALLFVFVVTGNRFATEASTSARLVVLQQRVEVEELNGIRQTKLCLLLANRGGRRVIVQEECNSCPCCRNSPCASAVLAANDRQWVTCIRNQEKNSSASVETFVLSTSDPASPQLSFSVESNNARALARNGA